MFTRKRWGNSRVTITGNSRVTINGNSRVTITGNSRVTIGSHPAPKKHTEKQNKEEKRTKKLKINIQKNSRKTKQTQIIY